MRLGLQFLALGVCCHVLAAAMPTAQAAIVAASHTATSGLNDTNPAGTTYPVGTSPEIVLGGLGVGARPIRDRSSKLQPALFDSNTNGAGLPPTPWIALASPGGTVSALPFPTYLNGADFVRVNQNNRSATGYELTITVDTPSRAYLLLDNRNGVPQSAGGTKFEGGNSFLNSYFEPDVTHPSSPVLWVSTDGWQRVNTGITPNGYTDPNSNSTVLADYVGLNEGSTTGPNDDTGINQYYAIYSKLVPAGSFKTFGQSGNNMYMVAVVAVPEANSLLLMSVAGVGLAARRRWMR